MSDIRMWVERFPLTPDEISELGSAERVEIEVYKRAISEAVKLLPECPIAARGVLMKAWDLYVG